MPKCSICQRDFVQEYSKQRHEKLCREKEIAEKKHIEGYKGVRRR